MVTRGTRSGLSSIEVSWGVTASVRVILLTRCISVEGNSSYSHVCKDSQ